MAPFPTQDDLDLHRPEISNRVLKGLYSYFRQAFGAELIDALLDQLIPDRALIEDPEGWISFEVARRFGYAVCEAATGQDELPGDRDHPFYDHWRMAGRRVWRREEVGAIWHVVRGLGSPGGVIERFPWLLAKGNRTLSCEVEREGERTWVVRVGMVGPYPFDWAVYWNVRGVLEGLPTAWDLPMAQVSDVSPEGQPFSFPVALRITVDGQPPRQLAQALALAAAGGALGAATAAALSAGLAAPAAMGILAGLALAGWRSAAVHQAERREEVASFQSLIDAADERVRALWDERDALRRTLLVSRKIAGYLPANLVERIMVDPEEETRLGGEQTFAVVLFSDIKGFTPRSEGRPPAQVLAELNLYFSHMDPVVEAHGGVIDKRIGDGLMVVFTSSQRSGEGLAELQRRAVRCAVGMLTALPACNAQLGARGSEPIQIRVGVAGGPLVQGNVGSAARLEYTVIGDTVNLAARLEGQASPGCALIQEAVFAAGGAGHAPLSRRTIKVKGRVEPVAVVEVGVGEGALALGVSG